MRKKDILKAFTGAGSDGRPKIGEGAVGSTPVLGTINPAPVAGFPVLRSNPDKRTDGQLATKALLSEVYERVMGKMSDISPYKLAKVYNGDSEQFAYFSYWSKIKQKYILEMIRYGLERGV
jgi:hypothetical protein